MFIVENGVRTKLSLGSLGESPDDPESDELPKLLDCMLTSFTLLMGVTFSAFWLLDRGQVRNTYTLFNRNFFLQFSFELFEKKVFRILVYSNCKKLNH